MLAIGLFCLFIHECGHLLAGFLTGGELREFALFSLRPQVRFADHCTAAEFAFRAAAGSGLFWLVYLTFLVFPLRQRVSDLTSSLLTCFAFIELLGWVLSALFPDAGGANDAVAFLEASGTSPYLVVTVCLTIALAGAVLLRANRHPAAAAA